MPAAQHTTTQFFTGRVRFRRPTNSYNNMRNNNNNNNNNEAVSARGLHGLACRKVVQDISAKASSVTSCGGLSREHQFQL